MSSKSFFGFESDPTEADLKCLMQHVPYFPKLQQEVAFRHAGVNRPAFEAEWKQLAQTQIITNSLVSVPNDFTSFEAMAKMLKKINRQAQDVKNALARVKNVARDGKHTQMSVELKTVQEKQLITAKHKEGFTLCVRVDGDSLLVSIDPSQMMKNISYSGWSKMTIWAVLVLKLFRNGEAIAKCSCLVLMVPPPQYLVRMKVPKEAFTAPCILTASVRETQKSPETLRVLIESLRTVVEQNKSRQREEALLEQSRKTDAEIKHMQEKLSQAVQMVQALSHSSLSPASICASGVEPNTLAEQRAAEKSVSAASDDFDSCLSSVCDCCLVTKAAH